MLGIGDDLCPSCYWAERNVRDYLMTRLHDWEADPTVQRELVDRRGLCQEHTAAALSFGSPQGISGFLPALAREFAVLAEGRLNQHEMQATRIWEELSQSWSLRCILCEIKKRTESDRLATVRRELQREDSGRNMRQAQDSAFSTFACSFKI